MSCSEQCQYSVPQEQTFIPKVQVYFADFPYSHCSTKLEVISFGDLLRFLVRFMTFRETDDCIFTEVASNPRRPKVDPALFRIWFVKQLDSTDTMWWYEFPSTASRRKDNSSGTLVTLLQSPNVVANYHEMPFRAQEYEPASLSRPDLRRDTLKTFVSHSGPAILWLFSTHKETFSTTVLKLDNFEYSLE